jgi:hypothetical protein
MIVEPVPTSSPSRRRRAMARLAVLVPVALLVAVAGFGLLGRPASPDTPAAALERPTDASVSPASVAMQRPSITITTDPPPRRTPVPVSIDGLAVLTVSQALAGPAVSARGKVVAIGGYFGIPIVPADCGDGIDPIGPLCERSTLLAEEPWSMGNAVGFSGFGPHVHALAPIGLRLPDQVSRTTMAAGGDPITAVVIGRFGDFLQVGCAEVNLACEVGFELAAVAWAAGSPVAVRPFVDPTIGGDPPEWIASNAATAGRRVVASSGIVLEIALVRPRTLPSLDARAARRIRRDDPVGYLWYVRGLRPSARPGAAPYLVWGVVDDTTLRTLASGRDHPR